MNKQEGIERFGLPATVDPKRLTTSTRKAYRIWRQSGFRGVQEKLRWKRALREEKKASRKRQRDYLEWVAMYDTPSEDDRKTIAARITKLDYQPVISVIVPVYNTNERYLRIAIESVCNQLYPHWELCIADDNSNKRHIRTVLEEYSRKDHRIKVIFREIRGHISEASNTALELANGEFIALLDHDDELSEHALYMIAEELNISPEADLIYSDEDKLDRSGKRNTPHFKTDWNPDLFCSYNFISHLGVYRTEIVRRLGGFRPGYDGSQDYDLAFRVVEQIPESHIRHIPHVLYHWRDVRGSVGEEQYTHETAQRAISAHLLRRGSNVAVTAGYGSTHRVVYPVPSPSPLVSVVVLAPSRLELLRRVVRNFLSDTDYHPLELVIISNSSSEQTTTEYLKELQKDSRVIVVSYDGIQNVSAMRNQAVRKAEGDLLLFIDSDLRVASPEWLKEMVSHGVRPEIGAVGPKLCFDDNKVENAGIIAGINGSFGHAHRNVSRRWGGYFARSQVIQNYSAVSGACLLIRRKLFLEMEGFNEADLPATFSDIDLCLRVQEKGYRILWTPYAELYCDDPHYQADDTRFKEWEYMKSRWGNRLLTDPYYNPNLTLEREDFSFAVPPRTVHPWRSLPNQDRNIPHSRESTP